MRCESIFEGGRLWNSDKLVKLKIGAVGRKDGCFQTFSDQVMIEIHFLIK
jgi:hypothetical protein